MLNNNVAPNTVVTSRVIYHTLRELNSTPSPSRFLKGVIHSRLKASVCSQLPNCSPLVRALVPIYKATAKPVPHVSRLWRLHLKFQPPTPRPSLFPVLCYIRSFWDPTDKQVLSLPNTFSCAGLAQPPSILRV